MLPIKFIELISSLKSLAFIQLHQSHCLPHSSHTRICLSALNYDLKSVINNSQWNISSTYLWLFSPCGPWPLFQFLNPYKLGRTPRTEDQPIARPLPVHRTAQTQYKRTQTSMPRVGFEPTNPVLVKTAGPL
jgi:hypothetical protein